MNKENRILFEGNPFPNGHIIKEFIWSARLENDGLYFDFHLQTGDYGAEDGYDEPENYEPESDWKAKIAWQNFHKCTISSTEWHDGGVKVADSNIKIDILNLSNKEFNADTPPIDMEEDYEERAFHIYLLGHDACADHKIVFKTKHPDNSYDIGWTGKIALAYIGEFELDHKFVANIQSAKFQGIYYNNTLSQSEAITELSKYVTDTDIFTFQDLNPKSNKREYKLILK
jgi:hypothetical protein